MGNLIAIGSENKSVTKSNRSVKDFEETYFKNSIPYNKYDNSESQLKIFFGKSRDPNQTEDFFYPDLLIINNSDLLREVYESKLNDMGIN